MRSHLEGCKFKNMDYLINFMDKTPSQRRGLESALRWMKVQGGRNQVAGHLDYRVTGTQW